MKKLLLLVALLALAAIPSLAQAPVTGPYLVDYFSNNPPGSVIGSITAGSTQITVSSTAGIQVGWIVTGPGIPAGTTIVNLSPTSITMSANATATAIGVPIQFSAGTTPNSNGNVRLVNFGTNGTPLTSPVGDVCANIYVFDANQEMAECCSCKITPNGLLTLDVLRNLTTNPVTSVVPPSGDIKIVSTIAGASCTPLTYNGGLTDSLVGSGSHLQLFGASLASFVTETKIPAAQLSALEQGFLTQACQFARYLGSGKGICTCSTPF
jgi:hypothetical protein